MKTSRQIRSTPVSFKAASHRTLSRQGGMGATIILFTIALIVLVGAALAYASRGNPQAMNVQSARVYAGVILKQGADYRNAYSRFVFDGGNSGTMTFNATGLPAGDLFNPTAQYGTYQAPPPQSATAGTPSWLYNNNMVVTGVGTSAPETVAYTSGMTTAVCSEINKQLYGVTTIPALGIAATGLVAVGSTILASNPGLASGCGVTTDAINVAYVTLGES